MPRQKAKVTFTINKPLLAKLDETVNAIVTKGEVEWFAPHYRSAVIESAIAHYLECKDGFKRILVLNDVRLAKKK